MAHLHHPDHDPIRTAAMLNPWFAAYCDLVTMLEDPRLANTPLAALRSTRLTLQLPLAQRLGMHVMCVEAVINEARAEVATAKAAKDGAESSSGTL